jgi:dTDP-glucose 4,6-dehydratase
MHVLLTGAGGFVGHHVLEHFIVNTDAQLTLTDSFRHRGISERIVEVLDTHPGSRERVRVITHDLTAPWSSYGVASVQERGPVDVVLQIASESHVDRSITDPIPFVRNNVDIALNMLELARELKPRLYLHLSTDEVYGPAPLGRPSKEWDPVLPSNPYSASKAAQEAIAISYWRTYGVPLVIVNAMNLIGERQHPEKFIPKTIVALLRGESVVVHCSAAVVERVKHDGIGSLADRSGISSRCYLHARNLADAMLFLVRTLPTERLANTRTFPERFHVVGEAEVDNLTMAERIAEFAEKPLIWEPVDFHSSRPGHDLRYAMDGQRLHDLGWRPPVPLWESLRHVVRWSLEHPQWLAL